VKIRELLSNNRISNVINIKLLTTIGITLIIIGIIISGIAFSDYDEWNNNKQIWKDREEYWHNYWLDHQEDDVAKESYHKMASAASHAEEKAMEGLWLFFIGVFILINGFIIYLYSTRDKIRILIKDSRFPTTIKFCIAIFSIVCAIFLISLMLLQYRGYYYNNLYDFDEVVTRAENSAFKPELIFPEILFLEAITLLFLGFNLLYILKRQVKKGSNNKLIYKISWVLALCICMFCVIFIFDFILSLGLIAGGMYGSLFLIITVLIVIITSVYISIYIQKIDGSKNNRIDEKPQNKLLSRNVLNYRLFTAFLFGMVIISFIMIIVLGFFVQWTKHSIYWEGEEVFYKNTIPGSNVTHNLTFESDGGNSVSKFVIVETGFKGNWSVSSKEILLKPNEVKIITFTNYVPQNASDGDIYSYGFFLVEIDDKGKTMVITERCATRTTINPKLYLDPQIIGTVPWEDSFTYETNSSFHHDLSDLAIISFLSWLAITLLWKKKKIQQS
jgi:uncharacterized membrane protein YidH (DUF202 family)